MVKEERLKSKYLYKVLLIVLKYMPLVIAFLYTVNTALNILEIDAPIISNISGVSLFTWIFMFLSNLVFRFCICHRMFLYYILVVDIFNIIDYSYGIPLYKSEYIAIHSILISITLFLFLYFHDKNNKKTLTSNSR